VRKKRNRTMTINFKRRKAFDPDSRWRDSDTLEKPKEELECLGCGCEWLETVRVAKYKAFTQVVPGQEPVKIRDGFYFFRCIKCGLLQEPEIIVTHSDSKRSGYGDLLEILDVKKKDVGENL
jgi:hypothetical protein